MNTVSFSPDGSRIVTGGQDKTAKVWDARTGAALLDLRGHAGEVESAAFSPDCSRILTGSEDQTAKVWDVRTGTALLDLRGHTGRPMTASFSPDGTRIVTAEDKTATVWDARTGAALLELKGHTGYVSSASFSPDGSRIVTGSLDESAKVWDARTGSPLLTIKGSRGIWSGSRGIWSASFSPDGSRIATGGDDRTAKVWDARTLSLPLELKGHTSEVWWVSFSSDGLHIVTGSADGTAKVWDVRTGSPLLDLSGHNEAVATASFSPDGSRIVTGSLDKSAKVWDARTGTALLELQGHKYGVLSAAFSPDGSRIVTGSDDHTARVWDARTGMALLELKGDELNYPVGSVSFSSDGLRIVTGSGDSRTAYDRWSGIALISRRKGNGGIMLLGPDIPDNLADAAKLRDTQKVKFWDARTGQELKGELISPETQSSPISPDGRWIAHAVGNRVELIALNPDAEELDYRRFLTRPDLTHYREGYDEAKQIGDEFAARFYFGLLSTRSRAEAIITPLFASLVIRDDVLAALKAQPSHDPAVQAACLELAESWTESAMDCDSVGRGLVYPPGQPDAIYQRGLRLLKAAFRLEPDEGYRLEGLGVAQYRCGLVAEALATLTRSSIPDKEKDPGCLAFLAMAQSRLGHSEKARATLKRLREVMKKPDDYNSWLRALLREAETIELDPVFPADPFAP